MAYDSDSNSSYLRLNEELLSRFNRRLEGIRNPRKTPLYNLKDPNIDSESEPSDAEKLEIERLEIADEKEREESYRLAEEFIQEAKRSKEVEVDSSSSAKSFILKLSGDFNSEEVMEIAIYCYLVQTGKIYDFFRDYYEKKEGKAITRSDLKEMMFEVLFGKYDRLNSAKREFSLRFPTVWKLYTSIKRANDGNHNQLAIELQKLESDVMLQKVTKRITKEYPETPIFTIHDSIITLEENKERVRDILRQELIKYVGIPPSLDTDYLNEESLKEHINKELKSKQIRPPTVEEVIDILSL